MLKFTESGNAIVDYLKVSAKASQEIIALLAKRSETCEGIRVGVRTRGCSGLSYTIEYAIKDKNITKFDDVVIVDCDKISPDSSSQENLLRESLVNPSAELLEKESGKKIQIFIDPKVSMFLIGAEMIFETNDISSGFDFVNPNEKGRCGCKESFTV